MSTLIGCDPELFLSYGNKFISAFGMFPGTKDDPYRVEKGAIQVDGTALEFNIDPVKTEDEFVHNVKTVLAQMKEMVKEVDPEIRLNFVPVARFDPKEFELFPDECKLLGCDPDFSISGMMNIQPEELITTPIRTASGHFHIGWTNDEDPFSPEHFSEALSVAKFFHKENSFRLTAEERERLKYYGDNGAFRPKPYGVEIRSFSNIWVEKEETQRDMFKFVLNTYDNFRSQVR